MSPLLTAIINFCTTNHLFKYSVFSAQSQLCRIDLGFILDDSGSIKSWGFEQEKRFIRDVTRQLRISSTDTRIAVMTFSTYARMRIKFGDGAGQNWNSLNWALNWVRHSGKHLKVSSFIALF